MKIVVIGGSGLIGTKVVKKLTERGHQALAASPSTGAAAGADDNRVRLSNAGFQPIAADDVAEAVAEAALAAPINDIIEIAGPERLPLSELVARYLKTTNDPREVVSEAEARYFGARLGDLSLVPGNNPRLGTISLKDWLRRSQARNS